MQMHKGLVRLTLQFKKLNCSISRTTDTELFTSALYLNVAPRKSRTLASKPSN